MKKIVRKIENCRYAIITTVIAYLVTMPMVLVKVGAAAAFIEMIAAIFLVTVLCCLYSKYIDKYNKELESRDRAIAERISRARLNIGPENEVVVRQQKGGKIKLFYKITL